MFYIFLIIKNFLEILYVTKIFFYIVAKKIQKNLIYKFMKKFFKISEKYNFFK